MIIDGVEYFTGAEVAVLIGKAGAALEAANQEIARRHREDFDRANAAEARLRIAEADIAARDEVIERAKAWNTSPLSGGWKWGELAAILDSGPPSQRSPSL